MVAAFTFKVQLFVPLLRIILFYRAYPCHIVPSHHLVAASMTRALHKQGDSRSPSMAGHYANIFFHFFIAAELMTVFSAVLLGWVLHHHVRNNDSNGNASGAIFINLNATLLLLLSSWSSSLTSLMGGFMVVLALYPVTWNYLRSLHQGRERELLTQNQLSLKICFMSRTGLGALRHCFLDFLASRKTGQRQVRPLRAVVSTFCVSLLLR